jgi:hypothetical protein
MKWTPKQIGMLFHIEEVFSAMAIYDYFVKCGDNYKDVVKISELKKLFVSQIVNTDDDSPALETLHTLFDHMVEDFSEFIDDPSVFEKRIKEGKKNPARVILTDKKFKDAVRFVLIYRIAEMRKVTREEAIEERDKILNRVLSNVGTQIEHIIGSVSESLLLAKEKMDLTGMDVKRLSLRVHEMFDDGLETQLLIDGVPVESDEEIEKILEKKISSKDDVGSNPMYG